MRPVNREIIQDTSPAPLERRVERAIRTRCLLLAGEPVLVAVSGGLDSMVLLRLLAGLASKFRWRLELAHFNHGLRGHSSQADERLVRRTAESMSLHITVERAQVAKYARRHKCSIEMAARTLRHDFLARTAARRRIRHIALAHHADDQLELFFLRLLRGSGTHGLAGMKWKSPSPSNPGINLVRPLLDVPKDLLREYALSEKVPFREDASNQDIDIPRNRLRHELLPLLRRRYSSGLDKTLGRVMEILGAESEFVSRAAQDWLAGMSGRRQTATVPFERLALAVQRRCLQLQVEAHHIQPEFDLVEKLRLNPGVPVETSRMAPGPNGSGSMSRTIRISRTREGLLQLEMEKAEVGFQPARANLKLGRARGQAQFNGLRLAWRFAARARALPKASRAMQEMFDADAVGAEIVLRHWQSGDRFQPIGMESPVKLQDLFVNNKVHRARRHELVLATTVHGTIFWVEGMRISEGFKLRNETRRRLCWSWKRL